MRLATLIGTAALLLATNARAQDVTYDYDKSADFAALTNYVWVNGGRVADDLNHQRIVSAVDKQLTAKGNHKVDSVAGADLLVTYHVVISQDLAVNGNRYGINRWASARVEAVPVGALMVDIVNARTHETVWRGMVSRDLDPKASPEDREKNLNKAVEKLFKHYPPAK
ncbi:MAG TPA: DUF4136 domain-containing protein [Gemmatimonadales bacterium]|nr:DUF4136 domain-containing protein [Gemmatimonadales bacterium]